MSLLFKGVLQLGFINLSSVELQGELTTLFWVINQIYYNTLQSLLLQTRIEAFLLGLFLSLNASNSIEPMQIAIPKYMASMLRSYVIKWVEEYACPLLALFSLAPSELKKKLLNYSNHTSLASQWGGLSSIPRIPMWKCRWFGTFVECLTSTSPTTYLEQMQRSKLICFVS